MALKNKNKKLKSSEKIKEITLNALRNGWIFSGHYWYVHSRWKGGMTQNEIIHLWCSACV